MWWETSLVSLLFLQWDRSYKFRIPLRVRLKVLTERYACQKIWLQSSWSWSMWTVFTTHFCTVKCVLTGVAVSSSWSPCLLSNNAAVRVCIYNVWNSGFFITHQRVSSISDQHNLRGQRSGWVTDLWMVHTKCAPRHSLLWSKTRQGM